ncbi:hypothetical protein AD936_02525, partial [Gluconobacter japonicus]
SNSLHQVLFFLRKTSTLAKASVILMLRLGPAFVDRRRHMAHLMKWGGRFLSTRARSVVWWGVMSIDQRHVF